MTNRPFLEAPAIDRLLAGMADATRRLLDEREIEAPRMVGIHTGGVWIAERLHRLLAIEDPLGSLDISFYRDDYTRIGFNPIVKPSEFPFEVDDRHIILVDDVLQTGRTIRAAMNELFDYGRPASVLLVTLVDRGGRELPIEPAVVGLRPTLSAGQRVTLTGPDPLGLVIGTTPNRQSRGSGEVDPT